MLKAKSILPKLRVLPAEGRGSSSAVSAGPHAAAAAAAAAPSGLVGAYTKGSGLNPKPLGAYTMGHQDGGRFAAGMASSTLSYRPGHAWAGRLIAQPDRHDVIKSPMSLMLQHEGWHNTRGLQTSPMRTARSC